ncbi:MAG TPA: alpha/beta hydrolase-fold protein [Vicinamibacterales bacterium]|nr:alpha/beta hydrolase-fold protein [Vicinamibacterales bacterium]
MAVVAILPVRLPLADQAAGETPGVTGKVVETRFQSKILGQERELIVHLPPAHDPRKRYPVLYVLDGSSQDQPLADKLESLSAQGLVPATIVVEIPNMTGANRTFQLVPPFMRTDPAIPDSPKGTGDQFLEFMEKELIPFIAKQYGASDTRMFAGNSRGGLLVMYSLVAKPDLFAGRFCFSTPLWREDNLLVERVSTFLAGRTPMKSFLYVSAGENETDDIKRGVRAMGEVLKARAPAGFVWYVEQTPGVDHTLNAQESGWSALKKWGAFAGLRSPSSVAPGS